MNTSVCRVALIFCLLFTLASCATRPVQPLAVQSDKPEDSDAVTRRFQMMVGTWTGEDITTKGEVRRERVERHHDGTYVIQFRTYAKDGSYEDDVETGEWGISGDIYFTFMHGWIQDGQLVPANPGDPFFDDAYTILELTDTEFKYKAADVGTEFTDKRVPPDYRLPETADRHD